MDKNVVKEIVDSFLKMCDFVEKSDGVGCINAQCKKNVLMINIVDYLL